MAVLDDLKTAVANIQADVDAVKVKVEALKAASGTPDAALQPVVDALTAAHTAIGAAIQ